jgi:hypothetical protein
MKEETKRLLKEYDDRIKKQKLAIEFSKFSVDGFDGVDDPSVLGFSQKELDDLKKVGEAGVEGHESAEIPRPLQHQIDDYGPMTTNVDNRLVAIASSITTLKTEIKNLIVQAVGNIDEDPGCGTLTGLCTVYGGGISTCLAGYEQLTDDLFQVRVQNMSSRSYFGIEPAQHSTSTLSSSNVGIGSFNILTKDGGSGIGFTVTISSSGACATYYNQVTSKFGEIDTLRSEADELISTINVAKRERSSLQMQRWGNLWQNNEFTNNNAQLAEASDKIQGDTLSSHV